MSIKVIKAGMQTSIQDQGRQNAMQWGIAQGGAMDSLSMSIANGLLGNPLDHPVLEICLTGPTLFFSQAVSIAISGAQFELLVSHSQGNTPVENDQVIHLQAGDTLSFKKRLQGARAYLAIAGELTLTSVLNSYSTHFLASFGGFQGRALQAGDLLALKPSTKRPSKTLVQSQSHNYQGKYLLRCCDSVESSLFSAQAKSKFYSRDYTVSQASNRMGLRFEGQAITDLPQGDMTSSGLLPGSIQIPANGLPIVASVDGQTIGGYPRIANIIKADLFALGQLLAGDSISFVQVSIEQANKLYTAQQSWLSRILS